MLQFSQSRRRMIFRMAIAGCVLFTVLTTLAMVVYPGGNTK